MSKSKEGLDNSRSPEFNGNLINQKNMKDSEIKKLSKDISKLSYEDSLKQLDIILAKLERDDICVGDLQKSCYKAKLYLEHCDRLLDRVEQEVIQIDISKLGQTIK